MIPHPPTPTLFPYTTLFRSLNFLLLVLDVRNHVSNNVHRSDTGIPGPRNRLHRRNNDTIEIEHFVQRLQRDSQYRGRTIRVGDNEPITSLMSLLLFYQSSVVSVYLRIKQRDIAVHSMGRSIRKNWIPGLGKLILNRTSQLGG